MFCPKCNQQASEELRFCSRCGFPLAGVAMLLANDGALPRLEHQDQPPGRRGRIIKESLLLTLTSWAIALAGTVMWDWGSPVETIAKVGSLIFFFLGMIGLLRFLYAFLLVKETSSTASELAFPVTSRQAALPPQRDIPLTDYARRSNTKEMSPQVSVTENTTRLLEDQPRDPNQ